MFRQKDSPKMEKLATEKSGGFSNGNGDDDKKQEQPDYHHHQQSPGAPPDSVSPQVVDVVERKSETQELSIGEEKQEEKDQNNNIEQESSSSSSSFSSGFPPDLDPNSLSKLSEEIDQFLSSFLHSTDNDKSNPPEIPSCVEKFARLVELEISKYDSGEIPAKWCRDSDEDLALLDSVDRISKLTTALGEFRSDENLAAVVSCTSAVLQRAMAFLEDEFRAMLEDYRILADSESNASDSKAKQASSSSEQHDHCLLQQPQQQQQSETNEEDQFPGYSPEMVSRLKRIATTMISSGYEAECCQAYSIIRRHVLVESLSKIGCEKISMDDVQKMQWESLEGEIAKWITATKHCYKVYFPGEQKLCCEVFSDNPSDSGSLFGNLTRSVVIQLLNFAEAVAMTKRSAEKLFKFLDMYETLRDIITAMEGFLSDQDLSNELISEISTARGRIGEAVVGIFCDLENSIKADNGKTPVPGGAVHPLTRYIMNYVKYTCEYKETLEQVFQEHRKIDRSDASGGSDSETNTPSSHHEQAPKPSPFSVQLMTVMDLLDSNLESKSKLYKDLSLSYIFLMNNGRYIVQKIKGSPEIHDLMGDTWCRRRSSDLRQYHKNYQRETWSKVLGCLRDEGLQVNGKVLKPMLKERFKSFNSMFEEIHKTQSSWVVSDEQLQSELRVSISAVMIPAYRSFLGRFRQYLDAGRQTEKYIKFGPEDIETYIDELFDGNPASMVRRRT